MELTSIFFLHSFKRIIIFEKNICFYRFYHSSGPDWWYYFLLTRPSDYQAHFTVKAIS